MYIASLPTISPIQYHLTYYMNALGRPPLSRVECVADPLWGRMGPLYIALGGPTNWRSRRTNQPGGPAARRSRCLKTRWRSPHPAVPTRITILPNYSVHSLSTTYVPRMAALKTAGLLCSVRKRVCRAHLHNLHRLHILWPGCVFPHPEPTHFRKTAFFNVYQNVLQYVLSCQGKSRFCFFWGEGGDHPRVTDPCSP